MPAYEYVGNLHVHTPYSDGESYHAEVAEAAQLIGLDFLVFTDHNVWIDGIEGYYGDADRGYVLILSGEEVHDRCRNPQCNHTLVYGADCEVAPYASNLAALVNVVNRAGGLSFIAHPDDHALAWMGEPPIPWLDREVEGYTGLEIWNYMSRFKDHVPTRQHAVRAVFRPDDVIVGPSPLTLALWDALLKTDRRVVGIGGADAHGTRFRMGPFSHTVFPYDFLFNCVNTHILTQSPLVGDAAHDKTLLFQALREGRAFVGYDIPGSTRGFRFTAQGQATTAIMGEDIRLGHGVTLQVISPARAHIKIIRYGEVVANDIKAENLIYVAREPGAYRVEVWREYRGVERAWILSNPIYVERTAGRLRS